MNALSVLCRLIYVAIAIVNRWWYDEYEVSAWNAQWCVSRRHLSTSRRVVVITDDMTGLFVVDHLRSGVSYNNIGHVCLSVRQ